MPGSEANASKLVVFIEGGGECRTVEACNAWAAAKGSSSFLSERIWPERVDDLLNAQEDYNPDFFDWAKLYVPYCSGDMHSGQRMMSISDLGGPYYFAGHNLIRGMLAQMKRATPSFWPSHVLISGSSAGGIATILHADYFTEYWKDAVVKATPMGGWFYAGVTAVSDYEQGEGTPVEHLGFIDAWKPFIPGACAANTGRNLSACTDAHFLYPFIRTPLFIRENLFDRAKLMNCGISRPVNRQYMRDWGKWMHTQLEIIRNSHKQKDGFYVPSCFDHTRNMGFWSTPVLGGVPVQEALRNWFFELGDAGRYSVAMCGDLPCTQASGYEICTTLENNLTSIPFRTVGDSGHHVCDLQPSESPSILFT